MRLPRTSMLMTSCFCYSSFLFPWAIRTISGPRCNKRATSSSGLNFLYFVLVSAQGALPRSTRTSSLFHFDSCLIGAIFPARMSLPNPAHWCHILAAASPPRITNGGKLVSRYEDTV
ncbi:hypothetical protein ARMGADRAFT_321028 [Armillaria gallica]|uniref:Uncharacterized protein n=1 Tax=Armillaria gallica TaxID=47427 RepID=A0A2H3D3S4_ARMGA|nr:hypothetical protein ARMGADRAFT_321028 [Armillaria gallica]